MRRPWMAIVKKNRKAVSDHRIPSGTVCLELRRAVWTRAELLHYLTMFEPLGFPSFSFPYSDKRGVHKYDPHRVRPSLHWEIHVSPERIRPDRG
jgi:hypothetical protein